MTAGAAKPLPDAARMSADDWPGVLAGFGPDWRLSVNGSASSYTLQQRVETGGGPAWVPAGGRSPKTAAAIAAKYGAAVPGLSVFCAGLPVNPAEALPAFTASAGAAAADRLARDWRKDEYTGEVARDGSLRLAVSPCRALYRVQWRPLAEVGTAADWQGVFKAGALAEVRGWFADAVGQIVGSGSAGVLRGDDVLPRFDAAFGHLPDDPADNDLPGLPWPPE